MSLDRFSLVAAAAVAAALLGAAPAAAQVTYGGYTLGPDYGAMARQQEQLMHRQRQQMQAQEQQIVAQVMSDPRFGPLYQQHRAQGHRSTPEQFAYWLAATNWGSRDGVRQLHENERRNGEAEHRAWRGVQEAERQRQEAMRQNGARQHEIARERGNTLQGNSTYVGRDGRQYVLPHTRPGVVQRDYQGNSFVMDNSGQYHQLTPHGWQPMRPAF